jgi:hypothetical protein
MQRTVADIAYTNVWRIVLSGSYIVDDLIASKESQCIRVSLEVLNLGEDVGHVVLSVRGPRRRSVNGHEWRVDIHNDVNTGSIEDAHALVMVRLWVDIVDANGVDLMS